MAEMIVRGGFTLNVWARNPKTLSEFVALGARGFDTPVGLASDSDLVCICVTEDSDVVDIVFNRGVLDAMQPGSILAIHSTVHPNLCKNIAAAGVTRDILVLDAPVSGSRPRALARDLLLILGGDSTAIQRARPVFESYANPIICIGGVGDAMKAKLVNNFLATAHIDLAFEALELAEMLGLDREEMRQILLAGSGRSFALQNIPRLLSPRKERVGLLLQKDCALASSVACDVDVPLGLLGQVADAGVDFLLNRRKSSSPASPKTR